MWQVVGHQWSVPDPCDLHDYSVLCCPAAPRRSLTVGGRLASPAVGETHGLPSVTASEALNLG
jgi:hypothetical protein